MNLHDHKARFSSGWTAVGFGFWLMTGFGAALCAQAPPLCRAVQLEPFFEQGDCLHGTCNYQIDFRNVSATPCMLPAETSVAALNRRGAVMKEEHPRAEDGPLVLRPGNFGGYQSTFYSGAYDDPPQPPSPSAETYLFRFAPDDQGALRVPGAQSLESGPQALFGNDNPEPELSKFPRQASGHFVISTLFWPLPEPLDQRGIADIYSNPSVELHISVANRRASTSAGWNACRVVTEASEEQHAIDQETSPTAHVRKRSVYPCDWNGDLAHGVIAAGATVAFEVEAKLPTVCHLARYTISVTLENAPVKFAPLVLRTEEFQPDCDDSKTISFTLPPLNLPPDIKAHGAEFGLPVHGIRVGLEIPTRFADSRGIGVVFPGDPVIAEVWIENGRNTPLHFAGPNGFFIHVVSYSPAAGPARRAAGPRDISAVGLVPRVGSKHTGPIDVTLPPHTIMHVANVDLGAQYDFPVGLVSYQESVWLYPEALTGDDGKWNYFYDYDAPYSLTTVSAFHVEPADQSK